MTRRSALLGAAVAVALVLLPRLNSGPRPSPSALSALSTAPFAIDRDEAARANRGTPRSPLPPPPPTTTSTVRPVPPPAKSGGRAAASGRSVPPPAAPPALSSDGWGLPALLRRIGGCESGGDPTGPLLWTTHNLHSTASGAFEYLDSTWNHYGGYARAMYAPAGIQVERAKADYARNGTAPWAASRSCWA